MTANHVIILSGHSLFAEGTASSLRQKSADLSIDVLDPRDPELMAQIERQQPAVIILDSGDATLSQKCPVDGLLRVVPNLRIIRLDPQHEQVQIVTGEHRPAACAADLIEVICAARKDQTAE